MTVTRTATAAAATAGRGRHRTLWALQVLLALFFLVAFLVAAAGPKLLGQAYAVEMFDRIGAGQWLRYLVGSLELAAVLGLLVPRLAGLAALARRTDGRGGRHSTPDPRRTAGGADTGGSGHGRRRDRPRPVGR